MIKNKKKKKKKMLWMESLFVGIYSMILCFLLSIFLKNKSALFFWTGFLKHWIGWISGLHQWYCNAKRARTSSWAVGAESIAEGVLFLVCSFLFRESASAGLVAFCIGMGLHVSFEIVGLHTFFCTKLF